MILDFGHGLALRSATAEDHPALKLVCLKTGNAGSDASATEDDPELLGLIYAVPYQVLEPDFAFVVENADGVCGYLFGAPDTRRFNARLAEHWYPDLRKRVSRVGDDPSDWRGSDWARHAIHNPDLAILPGLEPYPSHGHIDLLPQARGMGIGRQAMRFLERRMREAGSTGLYLPVDSRNAKALAFYAALGFQPAEDMPAGPVTYMVKPAKDFAPD